MNDSGHKAAIYTRNHATLSPVNQADFGVKVPNKDSELGFRMMTSSSRQAEQ